MTWKSMKPPKVAKFVDIDYYLEKKYFFRYIWRSSQL